MKGHKTVEGYLESHPEYLKELELLRKIILDTGLEETVKWGIPCFVDNKKNVLGIGAFKSYVGLWFYQGALLKDEAKKLFNAQEEVTKAMRQWRFESLEEIVASEKLIKEYVHESVLYFRSNKEIKPNLKKPLIIPELLQDLFHKEPETKNLFEAMTLTKKRDFVEHIDSAKRMETKLSRLEKVKKHILAGIGLNDKYL